MKVIKRKKSETYFGKGKGGGGVSCSIWRSLVQYLSYQMAVKVFSVNLVILKNKIMYFWLDIRGPKGKWGDAYMHM